MNQTNQFKDTYNYYTYEYEQQLEKLYRDIDSSEDRGEVKRIARELGKLRQQNTI